MTTTNGIKCPACGHQRSRVVDTRAQGARIYRRRECLHCGHRYTTYEYRAATCRGDA